MAYIGIAPNAVFPHMGFNLNPFSNAMPPPPGVSLGDLIWERIRLQLSRFNRICAVSDAQYQAMVAAPDGNIQVTMLKENYFNYTSVHPVVCEVLDHPGWTFFIPFEILDRSEINVWWPKDFTAQQRNARPPVVFAPLDVLEDRCHGPFPQNGVLSLDPDEFINKDSDKIPRPRNPWIIYRQYQHKVIKDNPRPDTANMNMGELSSYISRSWAQEPAAMKAYFKQIAEGEKLEHAQRYPDYVYQPRKPTEKKKRMSKRKAKAEYEDTQTGPILSVKEQEHIHRNAVKFGVIHADTPFIPRTLAVQSHMQYDLDTTLELDPFMLLDPFHSQELDFNNYNDGLFEGFNTY